MIANLIRLSRPKQWAKNLLVFAGILFAGQLSSFLAIQHVLLAFAGMCLCSSGTYVLNDYADMERDRAHPRKKHRPLAAGLVPPKLGFAYGCFLLVTGCLLGFAANVWVLGLMIGYLALQLAYNLWLKSIAVADVFAIATGFVLRAVVGAQSVPVAVSGWLLFCTAALSLMLGFAKRREEFLSMGAEAEATRSSLLGYNRTALDILVAIFAGIAVMCYGIYCLGSPTGQKFPMLLLTAPFVTYGITRYLVLVFTENEGGEPADILMRDPHVIFSVLGFLVAAVVAVSGGHEIPILE